MRARLWGRAMAQKLPEAPAELEPTPAPQSTRPELSPELEQRLQGAIKALAERLKTLGSESPAREGSEAVVVRVMGRERGGTEVLPLPGIRVRFGWKSHQLEALTDVAGWAVARLPVGVEQGAYRVTVLKADGNAVASKKGTVSAGESPPVHHFELRARPELQESFERSRQWHQSVSHAAQQVSESL